MRKDPTSLSPESFVLRLQRSAGNRVVSELLGLGQAKLSVGATDDPYEREADTVAQAVGARLEGGALEGGALEGGALEGGALEGGALEGGSDVGAAAFAPIGRVSEVGTEGGEVSPETEADIQRARGGGVPLDTSTRASMERAFGGATDFGAVRLHAGRDASMLNDRVQAEAFTIGSDVFFRDAMPDVKTKGGRELLAHELSHTVQQGLTRAGRMPLRRMPLAATVEQQSGKKSSKGFKLLGGKGATNTYNEVLSCLKDYSRCKGVPISKKPSELVNQVDMLHECLDHIDAACQSYLAKKDPDANVVQICNDMVAQIPIERKVIDDIAQQYAKNPLATGNPSWNTVIPVDARTFVGQATEVSDIVGAEGGRGQNKEVKKVKDNSGNAGFFAEGDKDNVRSDQESDWSNSRWMLDMYGVKDNDIRLPERSIAMSRLDSLLDAGVIARTEAGLKEDKLGTFQWAAKGLQPSDIKKYPRTDPNLPRLMSRLQLIDAIAGQVDRHAGNYFVEMDASGKVTGVTGIDLDMAWTKEGGRLQFDVDKEVDKYPGFSRFVDEELAERIIALTPDDLRVILVGLLDKDAIDAAINRLVKLQALLLQLQAEGKLLKPNQWDQAMRAELIKEQKSYYGRDTAHAGPVDAGKKDETGKQDADAQ